ncbi:MAG: N-acetyltransferase [Alphaproteobacteria bacterium]|nr:N-acetyltransferase [Alphaproteobacteria bacterium]MBU1526844.1 N-acetyltransferase [Alphaproteobacteria bacterium]MBU2117295.1 N-acetyltransferase [Alphaproteobacteria bacterium]MBU2351677.1 N-acetyltransferase [Alphaproteobacteria bacterium]MBU2382561.1 N-acetyltransferase [Alphaproteobacteria bacterium]
MTDISWDTAGSRYVLPLGGEEEAQVDVRTSDGVMTLRRVFVPPSHEGQGLAARLMAHVADDARAQGLKIVPVCSYADVWFRRNKDQQDLLAA